MKTYTAVIDDAHVENRIAKRVLIIWVSSMLNEQIVDILVTETSSKCKGIFSIVCIA